MANQLPHASFPAANQLLPAPPAANQSYALTSGRAGHVGGSGIDEPQVGRIQFTRSGEAVQISDAVIQGSRLEV